MDRRTVDAAAIEAEVDHVRSLGIDALRKRWRSTFGATPPPGLPKDIISRMIAYRIQEEAFGGLDRAMVKLLDRLAGGEKPNELNRRLKPGTVLVREYRGERHTVTVVPDGFLWQDKTWTSLSTIAKPRNCYTVFQDSENGLQGRHWLAGVTGFEPENTEIQL